MGKKKPFMPYTSNVLNATIAQSETAQFHTVYIIPEI